MTHLPPAKISVRLSIAPIVKRFVGSKSGATAIEYGLIVAILGAGALAASSFFGDDISAQMAKIDGAFDEPETTIIDEQERPASRYLEHIGEDEHFSRGILVR